MSPLSEKSIQLLQALIREYSPSGQEAATAAILAAFLAEEGIPSKRVGNNIWAVNANFDSKKRTIVLNSHHDTVKLIEGWTEDPHGAQIKEGRLYGLGSNDAGGCLVSLIAVFSKLYRAILPFNLCMIASAEEENFGPGGVSSVLSQLGFEPSLAIIGEPTQMKLATAEKGLIVIDAECTGRSGHVARDTGINAIYLAQEDIAAIRTHNFEQISEVLGPVKTTVSQISGGTQHNVIPDRCSYVIDVRVNECYSLEEVLSEIDSITNAHLSPRSLKWRPSGIDPNHPIVKRARKCGLEIIGSPTLSDQVHFDCPSVKIGPGDSDRSHTANEFIVPEEISEAIEIYLNLLIDLEL